MTCRHPSHRIFQRQQLPPRVQPRELNVFSNVSACGTEVILGLQGRRMNRNTDAKHKELTTTLLTCTTPVKFIFHPKSGKRCLINHDVTLVLMFPQVSPSCYELVKEVWWGREGLMSGGSDLRLQGGLSAISAQQNKVLPSFDGSPELGNMIKVLYFLLIL